MNDALATQTPATNGVIRRETSYSVMPLAARLQYANELAKAADLIPRGLFDKATGRPSPAKIFLVLETGSMLGLDPMAALQGIDVIEGQATISPQLMTGILRAAGHKIRIHESGTVEGGDYAVEVTLIRADDPDEPLVADWSMKKAQRAGLGKITLNAETGEHYFMARSDRDNPLPWELYTEDMCLWRAVGRLGRRGGNDVLMSISYIPEELLAVVGPDGMRGEIVGSEQEAELIGRIKALDDKADMGDLYREIRDGVGWTPRLSAEFDAHLLTITKDSRTPQEGAPGQTGMKELDGTPPEAPQEPRDDVEGAPDGETPAETAPEGAGEAPEAAPEASSEVDPARDLDYEASLAAADPTDYDDAEPDGQGGVRSATLDRERAAAADLPPAADGGMFDASALGGKPRPSRP